MRISKNRIDLDDKVLQKPVLKDYGETVVTANSSTAYTCDLTEGNVFDITLTGNCSFTFSNPPASGTAGSFTLILTQDSTGSRTVTWPSAVTWFYRAEPPITSTAGTADILFFMTKDGGANWFGSAVAQNYTIPTVPGAPTSLTATPGDEEMDLAWSAPVDDGGSAITGYKIYRDTSATPTTLIDTIGATTSYNDTGLTNDTTYYYRVKATNAVGDSDYSNEDSATAGIPFQFHDAVQGQANGSGDVTLNYPAGTQAGFFLFLVIQHDEFSGTIDTPSGWTRIDDGAASSLTNAWFYRIAGVETSVATTTDMSSNGGAALIVYSGSSPSYDGASTVVDGSGTSPNPASVSAVDGGFAIVSICLDDQTGGMTGPSGYIERLDTNIAASGNGRVGFYEKAITATGTEDPGTMTVPSDNYSVITIAISPS